MKAMTYREFRKELDEIVNSEDDILMGKPVLVSVFDPESDNEDAVAC
jgi:hypothetical protein